MKLLRVIVVQLKFERSTLPTYLTSTVLAVAVIAANPETTKSNRATAGTVFMLAY